MKKKHFGFLLICMLFSLNFLKAQEKKKAQIILKGTIFNEETFEPISNVHILSSSYATISNDKGYFSLNCYPGDTIRFSYVGFIKSYVIIPDSVREEKLSLLVYMVPDTILLKEVDVIAWCKKSFKNEFLKLQMNDPREETLKQNINYSLAVARTTPSANWGSEENQAHAIKTLEEQVLNKTMVGSQYTLNPVGMVGALFILFKDLDEKDWNLKKFIKSGEAE
jgi:hypothetical protein